MYAHACTALLSLWLPFSCAMCVVRAVGEMYPCSCRQGAQMKNYTLLVHCMVNHANVGKPQPQPAFHNPCASTPVSITVDCRALLLIFPAR